MVFGETFQKHRVNLWRLEAHPETGVMTAYAPIIFKYTHRLSSLQNFQITERLPPVMGRLRKWISPEMP